MKRLTTGEVSKRLNISVRTLRYYDQIDLLTPDFKDTNGKRLYSEDDLFQLEKIIILKSLSLPLEDIRSVLEKLSYKQILISHYNYLQERLSELQTNISHTSSLINMIDLEESLSWEHVNELVRSSPKISKRWLDYFQEEEKLILQNAVPNLSDNDKSSQKYISLLRKMDWCIEHNIKPESTEGFEIGSELIALSDEAFQGNETLMNEFWEIRRMPSDQTGLYPISEDVLEFAESCITYATT